MIELLSRALEAHGGIDQWNQFEMVHATIVSGGQLWAMKGIPQDPVPREMKVATKHEWASVAPFGSPDQRTDFTPGRIAIQKVDGTVVSERLNPAAHAEGKAIDAPWDVLDRAYFNGYALWTYLTTPFLLTLPGFVVDEIEPWRENKETWRGSRYLSARNREPQQKTGFLLRPRLSLASPRLSRRSLRGIRGGSVRLRTGHGSRHNFSDKTACLHER